MDFPWRAGMPSLLTTILSAKSFPFFFVMGLLSLGVLEATNNPNRSTYSAPQRTYFPPSAGTSSAKKGSGLGASSDPSGRFAPGQAPPVSPKPKFVEASSPTTAAAPSSAVAPSPEPPAPNTSAETRTTSFPAHVFVSAPTVGLRASPDTDGALLKVLSQGTELTLSGEAVGPYAAVVTPQGRVG